MRARYLLLLASALAACQSSTGPKLGETFDLGLHQQATVGAAALVVRFDSVLNDSRCPLGMMCIAAGSATVRVTVTSAFASSPVTLSTNPDSSTRQVQGVFLDLVALNPYPQQDPPRVVPPTVTLRMRPAPD